MKISAFFYEDDLLDISTRFIKINSVRNIA